MLYKELKEIFKCAKANKLEISLLDDGLNVECGEINFKLDVADSESDMISRLTTLSENIRITPKRYKEFVMRSINDGLFEEQSKILSFEQFADNNIKVMYAPAIRNEKNELIYASAYQYESFEAIDISEFEHIYELLYENGYYKIRGIKKVIEETHDLLADDELKDKIAKNIIFLKEMEKSYNMAISYHLEEYRKDSPDDEEVEILHGGDEKIYTFTVGDLRLALKHWDEF